LYCQSRNHIRDGVCLPEQKNMHITIPVHLSGGVLLPGQQLGNNLGAFVARLPATTEIDSVSRLLAVHDELNYLKRTPAAFVSFLLAKSLSYSAYILPQTLTSWVFRRASAGSSAVVTNVRMLHSSSSRRAYRRCCEQLCRQHFAHAHSRAVGCP
jgi:hypothetical protein